MKNLISDLWCNMMHDAAMWPVHGHYECRVCGRQYPVAWERTEQRPSASGMTRRLELARASK